MNTCKEQLSTGSKCHLQMSPQRVSECTGYRPIFKFIRHSFTETLDEPFYITICCNVLFRKAQITVTKCKIFVNITL